MVVQGLTPRSARKPNRLSKVTLTAPLRGLRRRISL
jgi:hypothetical protein